MYKKPKNKILFVIFIFIILLIISILIISVYNSKRVNVEEYKISSNSILYDENYNYISTSKDCKIKREWDKNYYLLLEKNEKHLLGKETVVYNKSKNQITIYGTIYQVFSNGDIAKKAEKTVISNTSDFQFFKLNDREYLVIGDSIGNANISTKKYLVVSINKAGDALLINDNLNIKTINPLVINIGNVKFDVANEKLIIEKEEIDLKKINGSTNEYKEEKKDNDQNDNKGSGSTNNNSTSNNNQNNNSNNNNNNNNNSQVYNDIISQIVNITGVLSNNNKTNLYKNVSLRGVSSGANYIDINYSIIDPEQKYANVFLTLIDNDNNKSYYYLDKNSKNYRITGLKPNNQYEVNISYTLNFSNFPIVADTIITLTNNDPTVVKITKIKDNKDFYYKVKMYNQSIFESANIALTDCNNTIIAKQTINVNESLTANGSTGVFSNVDLNNFKTLDVFVCLEIKDAKTSSSEDVNVNSYHKIKID